MIVPTSSHNVPPLQDGLRLTIQFLSGGEYELDADTQDEKNKVTIHRSLMHLVMFTCLYSDDQVASRDTAHEPDSEYG